MVAHTLQDYSETRTSEAGFHARQTVQTLESHLSEATTCKESLGLEAERLRARVKELESQVLTAEEKPKLLGKIQSLENQVSNLKHFKPQVSSEKIPQNGKINLKDEISSGIYRASLQLENGREIGFAFTVEKEADYIQVPDKYLKDADSIVGKEIINLEVYEYRAEIFFPREFSAGLRVTFDYAAREIDFGVKKAPFEIEKVWCENGEIRIRVKVDAENIDCEPLKLVFYEDQSIGIYDSDKKCTYPIHGVKIDDDEVIRITYRRWVRETTYTGEYSMKLGDLQLKDGKLTVKLDEEIGSETKLRLKERLFRKIGPEALRELEDRISKDVNEDRLVIIADFDTGKAYCGNKELRVMVSEGAKKLESIYIVNLDEEIKIRLSAIIEGRGSERDIGFVGESAILGKWDEIAILIFQKAGVPPEQFDQLKDKVEFEWWGTEKRGEVTDIVMKAKDEIMLGGTTFDESEVIAIIEVKSTTYTDNEKILMDRFNGAMEDLKKYIGLDKYKTAQYGIAVAFGYNPVDMLRGRSYPDSIGPYKNPYIKVFTRIEIENFGGG